MGPGIYLLAILGCGEGEAPCEQVRVAETRYESREACLAATEAAVLRAQDVSFPVVVAECRANGAAASRFSPSEVERPAPERTDLFRRRT